jgi:hypothetical protein
LELDLLLRSGTLVVFPNFGSVYAFDAKTFSRLQQNGKERDGLLLVLRLSGRTSKIDVGHVVDVGYIRDTDLPSLIEAKGRH